MIGAVLLVQCINLFGFLHLVGCHPRLSCHPFSIRKESDHSDTDNEDDAEDQDNTGVLAGPVAPLGQVVDLRVAERDCSHCLSCQFLFDRQVQLTYSWLVYN